jgi:hypothetical protein
VVEFLEEVRLLAVGRLPKFVSFHGEITRGVSGTKSSTREVRVQDCGGVKTAKRIRSLVVCLTPIKNRLLPVFNRIGEFLIAESPIREAVDECLVRSD